MVVGVMLAGIVASGPATAQRAARAPAGKLAVGVQVLRFSAAGKTVSARALVTARLTDSTGQISSIRQQVVLTAKTAAGCRVLHLVLDRLSLKLLGLNADLERVILDITGKRTGGPLGSLFCTLARAKVASARAAAARALTARMRSGGNRAMQLTANLTPQATASQASQTCQVLDLVVGPLNLDLLGLVVDLQRVHLSVTATRGQGKLGDLFCQLADNATTTTTTTTPAN
jgi:hypothetical protein